MKTFTVTVTDDDAEILEADARTKGIAIDDLLHTVVTAHVANHASPFGDRPDPLAFIGLGSSRESGLVTDGPPKTPEEAMARYIWEDAFGGTRPWFENNDTEDGHEGPGADLQTTPKA